MAKISTTDLDVFPLALGGNVFGWTANQEESFAVLDAYAAAGGNFIDTADMYSAWAPGNSGGESETIIGRWMKARGNRDRMIIGTKVGMLEPLSGLSANTIPVAAEQSLGRLQTDRIDLYYAHKDDPKTPLEETLGAFDTLVREGKVRYIAASNYAAPRLVNAALKCWLRLTKSPEPTTQRWRPWLWPGCWRNRPWLRRSQALARPRSSLTFCPLWSSA